MWRCVSRCSFLAQTAFVKSQFQRILWKQDFSQLPDSEEELVSDVLTPPWWRAAAPQLPANTVKKCAHIWDSSLSNPWLPSAPHNPQEAPEHHNFCAWIPNLQTPLVTGNCWGDRKPGSLDGMENTGNILWILRPPEPCRAEFLHSHICPKTNPTDALNLQPHRAWCHPHFP